MINNKLIRKGYFEISVNKGKIIKIDNIITDTALDEMIKILLGTATDVEIKYLALGDDNTAVTGSETMLGNEIFRTAVASKSSTGTGKVVSEFTILNTEAIGAIKEVGIFAGSTATSTINTGKLIARALWSKTKTADEEINIRRVDELIRS